MFAVCVIRDSDPDLNKGKAKPLYDLLVSYADVSSRDTSQGYPYREALATYLDCSKQTIDRATDYLAKEVGLVKVHRRKVEGKPEENDANLYELCDAWLIHGVTPPAGTPPQLVARYGHTVPGLDVDAWISEHAPDFDLAGWRAAYEKKVQAQEARREEQRRKERARRNKPKKGGGVTGDATPGSGESEGGSVMGDATPGVTGDATGGVVGDALSTTVAQDPLSRDEAPAARSAGAVRRTSTSGSGAAGASGCAATEGHGSSSDEVGSEGVPAPRKPKRPAAPRLSPAQRTAVRAVEAALPPMLVDLVEQQTKTRLLPSQNRTAVLAALESRTPEQIRERIARRWVERGYEAAAHHGELRNPVAVAMWLLGPTPYCPDPSCEDGFLIDTGEECRACTERKAQRRTAVLEGRLAPKGSSKGGPVECIVCERPFAGEAPETGECRDCRFDAETQIAALAARLAAEDADRQRKAAVDALWADPYGLQAQAPAQTAPAPF
uniref:hypothetical protein n=1 Tax=Streptomyces cellulosae TaxID=1968 RepID=UPI002ED42D2C